MSIRRKNLLFFKAKSNGCPDETLIKGTVTREKGFQPRTQIVKLVSNRKQLCTYFNILEINLKYSKTFGM